jgi:hypothetical protein
MTNQQAAVLTQAEARRRCAEAVEKMAPAIASGECDPTVEELRALAKVCDDYSFPAEAARVRRWLGQ